MVHIGEKKIGRFHQRDTPPRLPRAAFVGFGDSCPLPSGNISLRRVRRLVPGIQKKASRAVVSQLLPRRVGESKAPKMTRARRGNADCVALAQAEFICLLDGECKKPVVAGDRAEIRAAPRAESFEPRANRRPVGRESILSHQRRRPFLVFSGGVLRPLFRLNGLQRFQVACLAYLQTIGASAAFGEQQHDFLQNAGENPFLKHDETDSPKSAKQETPYFPGVFHAQEFRRKNQREPPFRRDMECRLDDECRPGVGEAGQTDALREGRLQATGARLAGEALVTHKGRISDHRVVRGRRFVIEEIGDGDACVEPGVPEQGYGVPSRCRMNFYAMEPLAPTGWVRPDRP